MKKILSKLLPRQAKNFLKFLLRTPQRLGVLKKRISSGVVTKQAIVEGLKNLGVKKGCTIMVHSSLSSFGFVENGAGTVIEALLETVGSDGNVCMPSFGPLEKNTFDVRSTPTVLGKIADSFWRMPEAKRSLRPTHSVACIGRDSEFISEGHEKDLTPFTKNSPYFKMIEKNCLIVGLGARMGRMLTASYVFEDRHLEDFPVKVYLDEPKEFVVIDSAGKKSRVRSLVHNTEIDSIRIDNEPRLEEKFERLLLRKGFLHKGKIGAAEIRIIDARGMMKTLEDLLKSGKTIYADETELD
ncbi:MAG TPA: AAC(3) family N-acetyltransferase [archaeon]|nr:AAC(3) family N-acetyltransferase [archaeon]